MKNTFTLLAQIATTPAPEATAETVGAVADLATAFGTWEIKTLAILIAVDVVLGIAAAIASKSFNFNMLATFMATGVLPYLLGFAIVEMIASGFGTYGQMGSTVIFVAIILNLLGSVVSNLANLGVNMPSILKKAA